MVEFDLVQHLAAVAYTRPLDAGLQAVIGITRTQDN